MATRAGSPNRATVEFRRKLLAVIEGFQYDERRKPTQKELAAALGVKQNTISRHIAAMRRAGCLELGRMYKVVDYVKG